MSATLHENIWICSLLIRAFGEDRPEVQDRSETSEKSMAATDNELNLDEPTTTTWGFWDENKRKNSFEYELRIAERNYFREIRREEEQE